MSGSITIRRSGWKIHLINNETHVGLEFDGWESADEFAHTLSWQARGVRPPHRQHISASVSITRQGDDEVVEHQGRVFAVIPCEQAVIIGHAILGVARKIEEEAMAEAVIADQALVIKTGALPFGLSNNPDIQSEAVKEALWGKLRRYFPSGLKFRGHFGTPRVIRKEESSDGN